MSDLISRQAAIDALEKSRFPGAPYIDRGILIALREIKKLPSAQQCIIRCKECADYTEIRHVEGGTIGVCESLGLHTCDRWFCGNAERRIDESD